MLKEINKEMVIKVLNNELYKQEERLKEKLRSLENQKKPDHNTDFLKKTIIKNKNRIKILKESIVEIEMATSNVDANFEPFDEGVGDTY